MADFKWSTEPETRSGENSISTTDKATNPPEHKLRWYQYKLSSLFVLTTLVAIACSWYANEMQKAAKRRAAIAEIEKLGAVVLRVESTAIQGLGPVGVEYYDASNPNTLGEPPSWFSWLRKLHGDEHLGNAVGVQLGGTLITDTGLLNLNGLTNLESLGLGRTRITDGGLVHLKGLAKLERLSLFRTQITDTGLAHLEGLTNLEWLQLCGTQITDSGLVHLQGLTKLKELSLDHTQITDAGLIHLKGLTKLEGLNLDRTQTTDAGLEHLKGLTNLTYLDIRYTQVTDEGVKKLQQALPNCKIRH